jgi:hypothetical protein
MHYSLMGKMRLPLIKNDLLYKGLTVYHNLDHIIYETMIWTYVSGLSLLY